MDFRKNIKEVDISGDKVNLKKGYFGYRVVHPIQNSDGTINKKNLIYGGLGNLIFTLVVIFLLFYLIFAYLQDIKIYQEIIEKYSNDPACIGVTNELKQEYNFTNLNKIQISGQEPIK